MKRPLFLCFVLCVAAGAMAQTTRIANNNPGATPGVNVYTGATALQDAINASANGDIIHVIPGSVSNGDVIIAGKGLTILGVGLNPGKDLGTRSLVGQITLNAGSSNTRLSGLHMGRCHLAAATGPYTITNILVENCQIASVTQFANSNAVGNFIVRNSIFTSAPGFSSNPVIEFFINSGVLITNNIIRDRGTSPGDIKGDGLTISNNLFYGNGSGGSYSFNGITNCTVNNNIFARVSGATGHAISNLGNTFKNNVVFGAPDNTFTNGTGGNSSTGHVIADPLMVNLPVTNNVWLYTYNITLQTGSPAINAGVDGTNIGPTGGVMPFDTEGTLLPLIESINMPAVVTKGVDLEVNIQAKGN